MRNRYSYEIFTVKQQHSLEKAFL